MISDYLVVWCTCPDQHSASTIAQHLVDQRLAACVTQLPGATSIYRWRAEVKQAEEIVLMIKTTAAAYERLEAAIEALHPYEVPELIAVPLAGGATRYLNWLEESTQ